MFWTHHWTATLIHIPSTERLQGLWRRLRIFFDRNPVKTESRLSCMLIDYKFQRSLIVNQANSVTQVRLTNWISLKMSWNLRCAAHLSRPVRLFFFFSSAIDTNTHTKIEETHVRWTSRGSSDIVLAGGLKLWCQWVMVFYGMEPLEEVRGSLKPGHNGL